MNTTKRRLVIFLILMFLVLGIMFATRMYSHVKKKGRIVLGAKDTTGQILAEMMAQLFEAKTTLLVDRKFNLDSTFIIFHALKAKEIDMYVEFTGTALIAILHKNWLEVPFENIYKYLQEEFNRRFDLIWMKPFGFESSYVVVTRPEFAEKHGLKTLSDLQRLMEVEDVQLAFDPEFYARPEEEILEKEYQIKSSHLKLLDHTLLYLALLNRSVDIIDGYATDGFIFDHGLVILEDDKKRLPPYEAATIIRKEVLKRYPEIQAVLEEILGRITLNEIQEMNYKVEKKGENLYHVVEHFLKKEGYLSHS